MALFNQNGMRNLNAEVAMLREQGLTENVIMDELSQKGYKIDEIHRALTGFDSEIPLGDESPVAPSTPPMPRGNSPNSMHYNNTPDSFTGSTASEGGNIYERIEEITESMIDEKWDELVVEVKKIVEWKEKFEEEHQKTVNDLQKLKEDFKVLHQGVLGKLEQYDTRMSDVDTELKAVGKVFKDVVPQFVENVKELSSITDDLKGKKK